MSQPTQAPAAQEGEWTPANFNPLVFDTFSTLNTEASRPGIEDAQMSICDGWMPIGKNNLRTLPGVGDKLYDGGAPDTIIFYAFANIAQFPVCVILQADGSLVEVQLLTGTSAIIAPAGTIVDPVRGKIGISQWGSQFIIIVADQANGYFLYNGSLFQSGGLGPDVSIVNSGLGYTISPTITADGGTGSGATFTSTVLNGFVTTIIVDNPGSGYSLGDGVVLAFSGGGSAGVTALGRGIVASGTVASVSITQPGLGYDTAATATLIGGGGSGAEVSVVAAGGSISSVSVSAGGANYVTNPTLFVIDPTNPVAQASIDIMPFGVQGTSVETYQSRVFVTRGDLLQFTAPESVVDFSTADGGGTTTSVDSFLRVGYTRPVQTNGFLYLIADSSINYISSVTTSGNPPTTSLTNQNADPEVGTMWPDAINVFSRNIVFGNSFGVHVSYGGAVTKISDMLDGIYNSIPENFGEFIPSSAKATIFGKKVWMVLRRVIDQITGLPTNKLFMWSGKDSWWSSSQDIDLIFVAAQEINSTLVAYGTDGQGIYPLFQKPTNGFVKTVQSKLWDKPGGYFLKKAASRLWGVVDYQSAEGTFFSVSVDNEAGEGVSYPFPAGPQVVQWINQFGAIVPWVNSGPEIVEWLNSTFGLVVLQETAVAGSGAYTGLTATTDAGDLTLISLTVADEIVQYRG